MEGTRYLILIIFASAEIAFNHAAFWTYTGEKGTSYWHELFPKDCSGAHQSPIDILPEETIYNPHLKDFAIWYDPPKPDSKMYIKNNGHTVQVDLDGDFFVANGGLTHVYKALQFHFHWGHKEHHGSEHLIGGVSGPIEMHLVTYNHEVFSEIGEAVVTQGGLAVLGTMYEISSEDNPQLATIVRALKHIRDPELHEKVELPLMSLRDFLPKDISRYYRYNGSLTVPGCFESVIWTVFDEKQTISLAQLREFTLLLENKHFHRKHGKTDGHSRHRRSLKKEEREEERRAKKVLDELGIRGNHFQEAVLKSELLYMQMMSDMPDNDNTVVDKKTLEEEEDFDKGKDGNVKYDKDNEDDVTNDDNNNDDPSDDAAGKNEEHATDDEENADEEHADEEHGDKELANEENANDEHGDEEHTDEEHAEEEHANDEHGDEENAHDDKAEEVVVEAEKEPELEEEYTQDVMVNNFRPVQPLNGRVVYRNFKLRTSVVQLEDEKTFISEQSNDDVGSALSAKSSDDDNGATFQKISLPAIVSVLLFTFVFV